MGDTGLPCVHCGLCLDTCPTYRILGTEADSPRGRIYLMQAVDDGSLPLDSETTAHLDSCLSCLACETACPSGVNFHARIDAFRPRLRLPPTARARLRLIQRMSRSGTALRTALSVAHALDAIGLENVRRRLFGLHLMPRKRAANTWRANMPSRRSRIPPPTKPRARVALLTGCVADVLRPQVSRAAVEALYRNRVDVVNVPDQGCCGALALHAGDRRALESFVRANARAFGRANVDFIVSTAAGCGAVLKQYDSVLDATEALQDDARAVSARARDISEVLCIVGIEPPGRPLRFAGPVAYHDACHLLHAAKVTQPPRAVVEAAIGRPPMDLGENSLCCGSAGSYNLQRGALARVLGDRKAELSEISGAAAIAVGNVGCMLQMEYALARRNVTLPIMHPVELLAEAYVQS